MVVESTLRFFKGGGDKDDSLALAFVLGFEFAFMILSNYAEEKGRKEKRREATLDIGSKAHRHFEVTCIHPSFL